MTARKVGALALEWPQTLSDSELHDEIDTCPQSKPITYRLLRMELQARFAAIIAERDVAVADADRLAGLLADAADLAWDHAPSELCGPLSGVNSALAAHRAGGGK